MQTSAVREKKLGVIAHVGTNSIVEMIEMAKHAESLGVQGISAYVPSYYKPKDARDCAELMIRIAHEVPSTPIYFYYFPAMNSVVTSVPQVLEISNEFAPNVIGCKFTAPNIADVRRCASSGFNTLIGASEMFSYGLAAGADGCIGATFNFSGNLHANVYKNFMAGDRDKADEYTMKSGVIARVTEGTGNLFSARGYLWERLRGFDLGPTRYPCKGLDGEQKAKLDEFIENFNWESS